MDPVFIFFTDRIYRIVWIVFSRFHPEIVKEKKMIL